MNELTMKEVHKRRPVTLLAGGCLAVLCLTLVAATIFFGYKQNTFGISPTLTPTVIPTPHILVGESPDKNSVVHENFSSNKNDWGLYTPYGKVQVINGKLILQSKIENGFAISTTSKFQPSSSKYYVQADFSTDIQAASSYGLVFGLNRSLTTYYLFDIWPQTGAFRLLKCNAGNFTELVPFSRSKLSPYPQVTTLSVSFTEGHIKLYIGGNLVAEYSDADYFQSKEIGILIGNAGYQLFVDDIFISDQE